MVNATQTPPGAVRVSSLWPDRRRPDRDQSYLLQTTVFQPVFIQGAPRSGTTLLCELLQRTGQFTTIDVYHLAHADELLSLHARGGEPAAREAIDTWLADNELATRGFDGVKLSSTAPMEYAPVLARARRSPMLNTGRLGKASLAEFSRFCKKVALIASDGAPLLLNNTMDFSNFPFISNALPTARFVFIHRHPARTLNSQLRMARQLFGSRNVAVAAASPFYRQAYDNPVARGALRWLLNGRAGAGLRILGNALARATSRVARDMPALSEDRFVSVRYEDLCMAPDAHVARIVEALGFSPTGDLGLAAHVQPRRLEVLPEVANYYTRVAARFVPYLDLLDYGLAAQDIPDY